MSQPDSPAATELVQLADIIVNDVAPPINIADCSLRSTLIQAGADLDGARQRAHQ